MYHGSYYKHRILKPGIFYTKTKIEWDDTESNEFIYATTSRKLAEEMAVASSLNQLGYLIDYFEVNGYNITITSNDNISIEDLLKINKFYIYKIPLNYKWREVNNEYNGLTNEYKTDMNEGNIERIYTIDIKTFINTYTIKFN